MIDRKASAFTHSDLDPVLKFCTSSLEPSLTQILYAAAYVLETL